MKRSIFAAILLFASSSALYCQPQEKVVVKRLLSPNQKFDIAYRGDEYGTGVVSITANKVKTPLFNTDSNHIPDFKWLTNSTVSVRVHCGSPCWYERYYDTETKALSPEYEFALARNPISGLVAHVAPGPKDEILVSEIYSGKVRFRYDLAPKQCKELPFFYQIRDLTPHTISVKCSKQSVVLQIPLQSTPE